MNKSKFKLISKIVLSIFEFLLNFSIFLQKNTIIPAGLDRLREFQKNVPTKTFSISLLSTQHYSVADYFDCQVNEVNVKSNYEHIKMN